MARLNPRVRSSDVESDRDSDRSHNQRPITSETSRSPTMSQSSDKENRRRSARPDKRGSDRPATATSSGPSSASGNKRRRVEEPAARISSQAAPRREVEQRVDKRYYDPDQDEDERRRIKRDMRELNKTLNDSRAEYLQSNSNGIINTLTKADKLFNEVKQTSDATIDSKILVTAADLTYKKINELSLGDSSAGIDVDEFLSKCIAFMRKGAQEEAEAQHDDPASTAPPPTQTQRRRRRQAQGDDDDNEAGDALDWEYLGRRACFLTNFRPCLSGFLLGPLSVQKKVRQQTQRRAREARADPANATRAVALQDEDLEDKESTSLAKTCRAIGKLIGKVQEEGEKAVMAEAYEDMPEEKEKELMRRHNIADNSGVPLFNLCVNPKSFGQTVENMFYISFLIKEGTIGLDFDSSGMPTLSMAGTRSVAQRQETPRNQAVFTLDFDMWEDLVESCGIKESIIPHRNEVEHDDGTRESGVGWYD